MQSSKSGRVWSAILSTGTMLAFCLSNFSQAPVDGADSERFHEAALRTLGERYFAAYARKDLDAVVAMWSERSPHLAEQKRAIEKQFAGDALTLGSPTITRVKVGGDKASMRATVAATIIDPKGTDDKRQRRLVSNIECIKEADQWKVWRYAVAVDELAMALANVDSEAQRGSLLAQESELVTSTLVQALIAQGGRRLYQGNYAQALSIYRSAHGIAEQLGDRVAMAEALDEIAGVYSFQGYNDEALEVFEKSLALSEAERNKAGMSRTLSYIGEVERSQGDYIRTMEHFQQSLALSQEVGDQARIAAVLAGIGHVHRLQGNYVQALEYLQKGLTVSQAANDRAGAAHIRGDIALVYGLLGDYSLALDIYQRSLSRLTGSGHTSGMLITLENMGDVYRMQGNYAQALEHYEKSLKLSEAMDEKVVIVSTLCKIAELYRSKGDYTQALQIAQRSAALATQIGAEEVLWEALTTAGKAELALNRRDHARQSFEKAIATIETLRNQVAGGEQEQQRFFESKLAPYHAMVELLVAQGNPGEALSCAERAKGRVLLDALHNGRIKINKAMTVQEQDQERKLNAHLAAVNSQIYLEKLRPQADQTRLAELEARVQNARLDLEAFQTNLYAAHPELKIQRGEPRPLSLQEASALVPDDRTALLEFVVSEDRTYLFVLTKLNPAGIRVYPLPINQKELTRQIDGFRQMLSALDNRFSKPAHDLYDLLLKPAADQLQGKTRLTIIPDGPLWELPFQALQTPRDRYLIEDNTIFYAPSLTVLREMINSGRNNAKAAGAATVLAMGNPALGKPTVARVKAVMMDERLDPLPEAEHQVQSLKGIYGRSRSKIYIGAEALEERFKSEAKDFHILHLATHAILNDRSPMYSHLLLARNGGRSKEDGLLEAWELMNMDLKADLAVLSACETARGRVAKGEGMIGLTWALFVAGVPTTVVSQWRVRSDSTAGLMVEFHRQLKASLNGPPARQSAAEALRAAALKLKGNSKYRHPFHWAGFVVVGDA